MTLLAEVGYYEAWWIGLLKAVVIFAVVFQLVPVALLAERKLLGRFQYRYGPNRVGAYGAMQPIAVRGRNCCLNSSLAMSAIGCSAP